MHYNAVNMFTKRSSTGFESVCSLAYCIVTMHKVKCTIRFRKKKFILNLHVLAEMTR